MSLVQTLLTVIPSALLAATTVTILLGRRWRYAIIALGVQYLIVFWLAQQVLPFGLAAVKLVSGWMAAALISTSLPGGESLEEEDPAPSWLVFRAVAAGFVLIVVASIYPEVGTWIPVDTEILLGGCILIGMGLIQLGMSTGVPRVILGLLTVLSGFEVFYAALEDSVLVAGLLAMITTGLAVAGSYLMSLPVRHEEAG